MPGSIPDDSGKPGFAVGFAISNDPAPDHEELEQNGLRIFVEDTLVEPLDGRTLDVREGDDGPELIFRYRDSAKCESPIAPTSGDSLDFPKRSR